MTRRLTIGLFVLVVSSLAACSGPDAAVAPRPGTSGTPVTSDTATGTATSMATATATDAATGTETATATATATGAATGSASSSTTGASTAAGGQLLPDAGLAGANDPACRSTHRPVVLLHGTVSTPASNFSRLAPALQADERCVYAVLYGAAFGWGGIGPVDESADQVAGFVQDVLAGTGARQVDVVAFSQGALVLRDALQRRLDPAAVRLAVFIAPNYHGTTARLVDLVPAELCPACTDQQAGSPLLQRLDAGGELAPRVRYATLSSRQDNWVLPVGDQAPEGPPDRVRSALLEDSCPRVEAEHQDLPGLPAVINWVLAALSSDGRPSATFGCS